MGAEDFYCIADGKTLSEAFEAARDYACYQHGNCGYTGTIAEKTSVELVAHSFKYDDEVISFAQDYDSWPDWVHDKFGPAAAIRLPESHRWVFFGLASS